MDKAMEWAFGLLWRAMGLLFVAFAVLMLVDAVLWPLPQMVVAAPMAAIIVLWFAAMVAHQVATALTDPRLKALCFGASIKPFDWRLGDLSGERRPGGHLVAFGPLRFAWRIAPAPNPVTVSRNGTVSAPPGCDLAIMVTLNRPQHGLPKNGRRLL